MSKVLDELKALETKVHNALSEFSAKAAEVAAKVDPALQQVGNAASVVAAATAGTPVGAAASAVAGAVDTIEALKKGANDSLQIFEDILSGKTQGDAAAAKAAAQAANDKLAAALK